MKKTIAFFLTTVLFLSCFSFTAFPEEQDQPVGPKLKHVQFLTKMVEKEVVETTADTEEGTTSNNVTIIETEAGTVRFYSLIDSLTAYRAVGYIFSKSIEGTDMKTYAVYENEAVLKSRTQYVYSVIKTNGQTYTPPEGYYYFPVQIEGISEKDYDTMFYIRPYAILQDGTIVYDEPYGTTFHQLMQLEEQ